MLIKHSPSLKGYVMNEPTPPTPEEKAKRNPSFLDILYEFIPLTYLNHEELGCFGCLGCLGNLILLPFKLIWGIVSFIGELGGE